MAEQGRYDRDPSRGGYRDEDEGGFGRGGYDRGRDQERGRRSDSLFGSGWSEREERGWGSSGDRPGGERPGGERMSGGRDRGDDHDRGERGRGGWGGASSGRGERSGGGISSWFGGDDRSDRSDRDRDRDRNRDRGRMDTDDEYRPAILYRDRTPSGSDRDRDPSPRDRRPLVGDRDRDRDVAARDPRSPDQDRHRDVSARDADRTPPRGDQRQAGGDRESYGADDQRGGLPIDETNRLIASNKVEGTAVYGLDGERLGSIYNFMVEKVAGKVEYAVMTYGGFLGMGTRYYPLPWQLLKYDTRRGGYRIDLTSRDLERAPSFDRSNEPSFDRNYGERVHSWYGLDYR